MFNRSLRRTMLGSLALHLLALALVFSPAFLPTTFRVAMPVEMKFVTSAPSAPIARVKALSRSAPGKAPATTATEAASTEPATKNAGPVVDDVRQRYIAEVAALLNAKKEYPAAARRLGQQGRVLVQFRLARDGRVLEAAVLESSPYEALNRAARALIEELNGLKPFPPGFGDTASWLFTVPIDYHL